MKWSVFAHKKAPVACLTFDGWEEYCAHGEALAAETRPKESAPGIFHGTTLDGRRTKEHVLAVEALVLDSDETKLPEAEIESLLKPLSHVKYFFAWRRGKFHLTIPLVEPLTVVDEIADRRACGIQYFAKRFGRTLDETTRVSTAILHPYTRLPDMSPDERVITRSNVDGDELDLDVILAEEGYRARTYRRRYTDVGGTPKQTAGVLSAMELALSEKGFLYPFAPGMDKVAIKCPFHPDESHGPNDTSTILFRGAGKIHCSHNRCRWRLPGAYARELGIEGGDVPAWVREALDESVTERVSLEEAGRRIRLALLNTKPHERTATVVRVTTGAGKTRAVAEYLDGYCTPTWDAETGDIIPGKSAFLGTPTNALMREVSARVGVEHRRVTGVLAVLDSDGKPACLKYPAAKRLQSAGGDVHRLMCAPCEFREGCPARSGRAVGEGSLTLTNHTLLPSLVRDAQSSGKVPLIVWDESPSFVEIRRVTFAELEWMLDRFDYEDSARPTLARLAEVSLFGDRYRVAMRPLVEVLRRMRGVTLEEAVASYAGARLSESQIHRAESMLALPPSGTVWDRIRRCGLAARRVNAADMAFDAMSDENQAAVLRAEAVAAAVSGLLGEGGDGARVFPQPGALEIATLTESGKLWRDCGGVILDATAPVHDLLALRPDAVVVDIAVEDAGESVRVMVHTPGIGRRTWGLKGVEQRVEDLRGIGVRVGEWLGRLQKTLGRVPKVLVVSYKAYLDEIQGILGAVETHHYGDTRGYDGWFQRGFDAFVTIGDPYANLVSEDHTYDFLGVDSVSIDDYCAYRARAEAAQAHGRGRDPVQKRGDGGRLHLHFGRLPPLGWDSNNTETETL